MTPISLLDLSAQRARLGDDLSARIEAVLAHGRYIMGPEVAEFEAALAERAGAGHAVSCASGTDALVLALMALGIGPGDAVFTPTFTFVATAEAIALLGATPVFVDIEADSFNIDVRHLGEVIEATKKAGDLIPKAIIPVDLFGLPADYDAINAIAEDYGLAVLGDAAQSFGGSYKSRPVGSLCHTTATSFFPSKPLGCFGDGGAVMTDDDALAERMTSIRMHGKGRDKYDNVRIGLNSRLDTLQAAVLLAKLPILDEEIARREAIARRYRDGLPDGVTVPRSSNDMTSAWAQFTIRSPDRDRLQASLKEAGVPTAIYYPAPLHRQSAYKGYVVNGVRFPESDRASAEVLSLPMHPYLSDEQVDHVITSVRKATS